MKDLIWQKSTRCANAACVEVAQTKVITLVRDSKLENSPILVFDNEDWRAFLSSIR